MSDKNTYPSTLADKVLVRMPGGMRDQLKDTAKANNRTMNAEIVARLERSFTADKEIEQIAFEGGFEASMLREDVARLSKLLENQQVMMQEQIKAMAAEMLKHLYKEAGETIEAARQAAAELKAAGKWPPEVLK